MYQRTVVIGSMRAFVYYAVYWMASNLFYNKRQYEIVINVLLARAMSMGTGRRSVLNSLHIFFIISLPHKKTHNDHGFILFINSIKHPLYERPTSDILCVLIPHFANIDSDRGNRIGIELPFQKLPTVCDATRLLAM